MTVKVGEKSLPITIDQSSNTLAGIRDAINAGGKEMGLTATIVTDDAGARLVLSSATTGAGEDITVEARAQMPRWELIRSRIWDSMVLLLSQSQTRMTLRRMQLQ